MRLEILFVVAKFCDDLKAKMSAENDKRNLIFGMAFSNVSK